MFNVIADVGTYDNGVPSVAKAGALVQVYSFLYVIIPVPVR